MEQKPKSDRAVFTFGRMNPPTSGHKKLVNQMQSHAWKTGADTHVFLSHSHDPQKNPLTHKEKVHFAQRAFPGVHVHGEENIKTPIHALEHLHKKGYKHVTMMVGSDRHQEFHNLLHKYKPEGMHIEVKSAGERDPDAEGVEGMSASKMRKHASEKNFSEFRKGVPNPEHAKELYHAVRKGMKLENFQHHFKALFLVGGPGSGKDFIINTVLDEARIIELPLEKLNKAIAEQTNLTELNNYPSLIINGNADNLDKVIIAKAVLESMGYDTAMIYVYTTDEESKSRNDERIARGAKTFTEEIRHEKYFHSIDNMHQFKEMFEDFNIFNNSNDFGSVSPQHKEEIIGWLSELGNNVSKFFEAVATSESSKLWLMENNKRILGFKISKPPEQIKARNPENHPIPKGYKRVKDGIYWKLVKEEGSGGPQGVGDSSASETDKGEPMAKDNPYLMKNRGKSAKKTGEKSASPPPSFFDSRMGAVPSGGIGLTVSHFEPKGNVIQEKSFEKLRKNMASIISNIDGE